MLAFKIKQLLQEISADLMSPDTEVLKLAEELGDKEILETVVNSLVLAGDILKEASERVEEMCEDMPLTEEHLHNVAALADELDATGDLDMQRQAATFDSILSTLSKAAEFGHKPFDRKNVEKAVKEQIKVYKPCEAPLNTRTCPDHPGVQVGRVGDQQYQCALDKKIYDFKEGFTTEKGNKVPGGDVGEQTKTMEENTNYKINYSTRADHKDS